MYQEGVITGIIFCHKLSWWAFNLVSRVSLLPTNWSETREVSLLSLRWTGRAETLGMRLVGLNDEVGL